MSYITWKCTYTMYCNFSQLYYKHFNGSILLLNHELVEHILLHFNSHHTMSYETITELWYNWVIVVSNYPDGRVIIRNCIRW